MRTARRIFVSVLLAALAASILAVGVVGKWKGKINIDASKLPKAANPQQQKSMEAGLASVKKADLTLNLKANKTYIADAKNLPGKTGVERNEGNWKQEGNTLWLTTTRTNGKPVQGKKPQKFLITDGGRKIVLAAEGMPPFMSIVFTR